MVLSGEKQIVNVCDKNWTINKSPKGQRSLTWVQHAQKVKYGLQSRQVTSNNWPNFEHMRFYTCSCYLQVSLRSDKKWMDYAPNSHLMAFLHNQGQITPKWLVWSGQNSNSSEILCMSWVPAGLTKFRSIMNMLARRYHFPIIVSEIFPVLKCA